MSKYMSWNAMVGITRSKAICVCGFRPFQRAWKYVLKCSLLFLCFVNYVNLINLIGLIGIEFNLMFQDFNYSGQIVVQKCLWECSTSPQTIILNHVKTALPGGPVQKKMFDKGNLPQDMLMKYDEMPCNHRILMICPIIFWCFYQIWYAHEDAQGWVPGTWDESDNYRSATAQNYSDANQTW